MSDWLLDHLLAGFAVLLWLLCGLAVVSHLGGNQTAINGILGAGIGAVLFTALAWLDRG